MVLGGDSLSVSDGYSFSCSFFSLGSGCLHFELCICSLQIVFIFMFDLCFYTYSYKVSHRYKLDYVFNVNLKATIIMNRLYKMNFLFFYIFLFILLRGTSPQISNFRDEDSVKQCFCEVSNWIVQVFLCMDLFVLIILMLQIVHFSYFYFFINT